MTWSLFIDSATSVTLEPSNSIEEKIIKQRSEYRSASGQKFQYTWGNYRSWRMPIEFVNSADISQINSWWYNDDKLLLKEDTDAQVFSVQIVGVEEPVAQFIAPNRDLKKGVIVLETY